MTANMRNIDAKTLNLCSEAIREFQPPPKTAKNPGALGNYKKLLMLVASQLSDSPSKEWRNMMCRGRSLDFLVLTRAPLR